MKNRILIIAFLIFSLTNSIFGQGYVGEWYTPLRNKLLNISITKDSINFRECSFDLKKKDFGYSSLPLKIVKQINGVFIVSSSKDTVKFYSLVYFEKMGNKINMSIESADQMYDSLQVAEKEIVKIKRNKLFITLIENDELKKIRKKKAITKMSESDFIKFAEKITQSDSNYLANVTRKYKFNYLYRESIMRILLSEIGINSLIRGNLLEENIFKFENNPKTEKVFLRMTKR